MGYVGINRIRRISPRSLLDSEPGIGLWPFGDKKTDEQKAAENLAKVNEAIQNFKRAHEIAVRLYRAGLLPDKLRKKHVELRDKINNRLLVKIINAVTPEEYLEIHNYFANVRKDLGLGLAPLILIIGGVAALAALTGAAAIAKESFNHAKELELVAEGKITGEEYVESRKASGGDKSLIEKLTGINLMPVAMIAGGILLAPKILDMFKSVRRKT